MIASDPAPVWPFFLVAAAGVTLIVGACALVIWAMVSGWKGKER